MEKALAKALERVMKAMMRVIAMILRMLGLGGGSVSGAGEMPNAPKGDDDTIETADPARGLSPGRQQEMVMAILTYAKADRSVRKDADLSALPMIEKAFLHACDDKMLSAIAAMPPKDALRHVLSQTHAARGQIMRPSRNRVREPETEAKPESPAPIMNMGLRMAA
jgi:hypothetical protein